MNKVAVTSKIVVLRHEIVLPLVFLEFHYSNIFVLVKFTNVTLFNLTARIECVEVYTQQTDATHGNCQINQSYW